MLIRNAKDCEGKSVELWLRDGKIAAVGLGFLFRKGRKFWMPRAGRFCLLLSIHIATGARRALSIKRISPPVPPQRPRAGTPL